MIRITALSLVFSTFTVLILIMTARVIPTHTQQDRFASCGSDTQPNANPWGLPEDLVFDEDKDPEKNRRVFNDFSWRVFIALNWPALEGKRGQPDRQKPLGSQCSDVVWGSWKSADDLFPPDAATQPPSGWDDPETFIHAPWVDGADGKAQLRYQKLNVPVINRKVLRHLNLNQTTLNQPNFKGRPFGPLIAQNGTYVRYEIRLNKIAFDFIRNMKYYLKENLPNGPQIPPSPDPYSRYARLVPFPTGSIIIKAAWKELTPGEDRSCFYHLSAQILDWNKDSTPFLREVPFGLVGLHIAFKTASRPSWLWSTFEQVDNTEPGSCASKASFSKNDPTIQNVLGYDYIPKIISRGTPPPCKPKPVDVLRVTPIHPVTQNVNLQYHREEAVKKSIWEKYNLIATQWMPSPDSGTLSTYPDNQSLVFFPQGSVANSAIETYTQSVSCIDCHKTAQDFQFIFFPTPRAVQSKPPDLNTK